MMRSFASSFLVTGSLAVAISVACSPAFGQTIVGKWAIGGRCERPLSVLEIEPMGLSGEDFYCEFRTVRRKGSVVRWAGRCNFSENGYEPTQVVARLDSGLLRSRFIGRGWNGPFTRCRSA